MLTPTYKRLLGTLVIAVPSIIFAGFGMDRLFKLLELKLAIYPSPLLRSLVLIVVVGGAGWLTSRRYVSELLAEQERKRRNGGAGS